MAPPHLAEVGLSSTVTCWNFSGMTLVGRDGKIARNTFGDAKEVICERSGPARAEKDRRRQHQQ